jgi:hypothetical protein
MTTKHSPGPWKADFELMGGYDCCSDAFNVTNVAGDIIAQLDLRYYNVLYGRGEAASSERREAQALAEANARIMATSPKLLAALKDTLFLLKLFTRPSDGVTKAVWDRAEEAIAEAEGKS